MHKTWAPFLGHLSRFLISPPILAAFYFSMSLMEGREDLLEECRNKLLPTFQTSCCFWMPAQVLFFRVPTRSNVAFGCLHTAQVFFFRVKCTYPPSQISRLSDWRWLVSVKVFLLRRSTLHLSRNSSGWSILPLAGTTSSFSLFLAGFQWHLSQEEKMTLDVNQHIFVPFLFSDFWWNVPLSLLWVNILCIIKRGSDTEEK